mmetsp:Transcript_60725/g.133451  ORF Transcript_60725/g.133451 Transcript_60725/m.133451 type:complete len:203 (-) Transcript_60725:8-616(-)
MVGRQHSILLCRRSSCLDRALVSVSLRPFRGGGCALSEEGFEVALISFLVGDGWTPLLQIGGPRHDTGRGFRKGCAHPSEGGCLGRSKLHLVRLRLRTCVRFLRRHADGRVIVHRLVLGWGLCISADLQLLPLAPPILYRGRQRNGPVRQRERAFGHHRGHGTGWPGQRPLAASCRALPATRRGHDVCLAQRSSAGDDAGGD